MSAQVIPFDRVGDVINRETVICTTCDSRAMRVVTSDCMSSWIIECHNCGELLEGLVVEWDQPGTHG